MGANSKIEWCDDTFNPWIGCTRVSEGCVHCYAAVSTRARVLRSRGQETWGKGAKRSLTSDANWKEPLRWNNTAFAICPGCGAEMPAKLQRGSGVPLVIEMCKNGCDMPPSAFRRPRVFCASLADWLDDEVPVEWLHRLLRLVFETRNLDWLLLTKRPQNWRERVERCLILENGGDPVLDYHDYFEKHDGLMPHTAFGHWLNDWTGDNPPENVWVGTTVENQARAEERVPALLGIPARVRFLSCEPLLSSVDLRTKRDGTRMGALYAGDTIAPSAIIGHEPRIHWVIAGGESGTGAQPMHPDWARGLRDQCAGAHVPFLFKQWGVWSPCAGAEEFDMPDFADGTALPDDWRERPDHYRCLTLAGESVSGYGGRGETFLKRLGKKAAGRRLDGTEHHGFPGLI